MPKNGFYNWSSHGDYIGKGIITKEGSLFGHSYVDNGNEKLKKIMDNVECVSLNRYHGGAVAEDGSLYMWGNNYSGQLGDGTEKETSIPIKIMDDVVSVSLGEWHSGAVTEDGSLYMWGANYAGQLGDENIEYSNVPIKIMDNVVSVSLGEEHSGAITRDGSLYMWGNNEYGKLGINSTENSSVPVKIMDNVVSVSLGGNHNGAITKDGSLYMWGNNYAGRLGDGSTEDSSVPVKIMDNVVSVSLGRNHNGAITKDGSLYMWGSNYAGQLGDGSTEDSSVPVKIMDNVAVVSLGENYSGAITKDGNLYMWGNNYYGQLGNGEKGYSSMPLKIMDNIKFPTTYINSINTIFQEYQVISEEINAEDITIGTYNNLFPNKEYVLYALKSKMTDTPLSSDNLLYINQGISDENGTLKFDYKLREDIEAPEFVLICETGKDLSQADIEIFDIHYNGKVQSVSTKLTYEGQTLTLGEDYELSGDYEAGDVGEYTVTLLGVGDFTGEVNVKYHVTDHNYVSKITTPVTCKKDGVETTTCSICGKAFTKSIKATEHTESDWILDKAATAASVGTKHKECTVCKTKITTETIPQIAEVILSANSYTYNGKTKTPKVTVKDSNGEKIAKDFYTISYSKGRKNVGKYTVTIKFRSDYQGTIKKTYTINPKGVKLIKVTSNNNELHAKWNKNNKQVTGYQLQYSLNNKFTKEKKSGTKIVTIKKSSTTSKKIGKLKSGTKYYVRIRTYKNVGKTKLYSNWSAVKKITIKGKMK